MWIFESYATCFLWFVWFAMGSKRFEISPKKGRSRSRIEARQDTQSACRICFAHVRFSCIVAVFLLWVSCLFRAYATASTSECFEVRQSRAAPTCESYRESRGQNPEARIWSSGSVHQLATICSCPSSAVDSRACQMCPVLPRSDQRTEDLEERVGYLDQYCTFASFAQPSRCEAATSNACRDGSCVCSAGTVCYDTNPPAAAATAAVCHHAFAPEQPCSHVPGTNGGRRLCTSSSRQPNHEHVPNASRLGRFENGYAECAKRQHSAACLRECCGHWNSHGAAIRPETESGCIDHCYAGFACSDFRGVCRSRGSHGTSCDYSSERPQAATRSLGLATSSPRSPSPHDADYRPFQQCTSHNAEIVAWSACSDDDARSADPAAYQPHRSSTIACEHESTLCRTPEDRSQCRRRAQRVTRTDHGGTGCRIDTRDATAAGTVCATTSFLSCANPSFSNSCKATQTAAAKFTAYNTCRAADSASSPCASRIPVTIRPLVGHQLPCQASAKHWQAAGALPDEHQSARGEANQDFQDLGRASAFPAIWCRWFAYTTRFRDSFTCSHRGCYGRWGSRDNGGREPVAVAAAGIDTCRSEPGPALANADSPTVPVQLSLDRLLPMTIEDQQSHRMGGLFQRFFDPWPEQTFYRSLDFLQFLPDCPAEMSTLLSGVPVWQGELVTQVIVYVDGSSYNRQATDVGLAAWAFIVILQICCGDNDFAYRFLCATSSQLSSALEPIHQNFSMGELLHDALTAEAVGMVWAMLWAIQCRIDAPFLFHYDNQTVGRYAAGFGQWEHCWEYTALQERLRSVRHFLTAIGKRFCHEHLKAHVGEPWSEAVDCLAKATAKSILPSMPLPSHLSQVFRHSAHSFAWLTQAPSASHPYWKCLRAVFEAEGPFWGHRPESHWPQTVTPSCAKSLGANRSHSLPVHLNLVFASANVLTLEPGSKSRQAHGLYLKGRIASLQAQFDHANCLIVGLQECRTQQAATRHSASHFVFQSGADSDGSHGCELWVSRNVPYATSGTQKFCFAASHVHVVSMSSRHILVLIQAPSLHIRVLTVHAPYQSSGIDCASWWQDLAYMLERSPQSIPLIILGDLNAHVGSEISAAISSHQAEKESATGRVVHQFMCEHRMWLPSTFATCHSGPATTFVSTSGHESRIDYVCLPQAWRSFQVHSWVSDQIDLAICKHDHFVPMVRVCMQPRRSSCVAKPSLQLDVRKIADAGKQATFLQQIRCMPSFSWGLGVGVHLEQLTTYIQTAARVFKQDRKLPRQRYLSDTTWQVIQTRQCLFRMHRRLQTHIVRMYQRCFLHMWHAMCSRPPARLSPASRDGCRTATSVSVQSIFDHAVRHISLLRRHALWALLGRRRLHEPARFLSKMDRVAEAEVISTRFLHAAQTQQAKEVHRALRPLLGQEHRQARRQFSPLPAVLLEDGTFAPDSASAQERWRSFFAQPEGGISVTTPQLQELAQLQTVQYPPGQLPFDRRQIPTLGDLEDLLLKAKLGKAPGLDGLPAELFRLHPPLFAQCLWPLLAKCAIRCTEPLIWRGGEIVALPKTHNISYQADKFRSIVLSTYMSKVAHGNLRARLLPFFLRYRDAMHAGGVPKLSTDMLHLFVNAFALRAKQKKFCALAVFIDVQQAFYRALHPLILKQSVSDEYLVGLFQANGWSPDLLTEFRQFLDADPALVQAQVPDLLQAQLQAVLSTTWFMLKNHESSLTSTITGTRPGDSLADLLYGFLMVRFTKELHSRLVEAGHASVLRLDWVPGADLSHEADSFVQLTHASWVDDLVLLAEDPEPARMLQSASDLVAIAYRTAAQFGLKLNLQPDKTSVVLALRGANAHQTWHSILAEPHASSIAFRCPVMVCPEQARVVVLPDYIYLGSLQDLKGHPAAEVHRRFMLALPAMKMLTRNVFRSPYMPAKTKFNLFQSLVLSRLMYGAGAWMSMHVQTLRSWHRGLMRMLARIAPTVRRGPGTRTLDILADCGHVPPMMLLMKSRLSLFDRLCQIDTMEALFAVLQSLHGPASWLPRVQADVQCLLRLQPDSTIQAVLSPICSRLPPTACVRLECLLSFTVRHSVST